MPHVRLNGGSNVWSDIRRLSLPNDAIGKLMPDQSRKVRLIFRFRIIGGNRFVIAVAIDHIPAVICFPKTSFLFLQAAAASVIGLALATHRYRTGESLPSRARRTIFTGGNPCCRKASWKLCRFSSPPFIFR
jgi:hypothetical protein